MSAPYLTRDMVAIPDVEIEELARSRARWLRSTCPTMRDDLLVVLVTGHLIRSGVHRSVARTFARAAILAITEAA